MTCFDCCVSSSVALATWDGEVFLCFVRRGGMTSVCCLLPMMLDRYWIALTSDVVMKSTCVVCSEVSCFFSHKLAVAQVPTYLVFVWLLSVDLV